MKLIDRIERKIVRVPFSGCWIWMGAGIRYGQTYMHGKPARAHRAIYELSGKSIPVGLELMHSCDVPCCVNPDHLSAGTHQENMSDMVIKGRAKAPSGAAHWSRKDPLKASLIARKNIQRSHGSGADNNNAKVTQEIADRLRAKGKANPGLTMAQLGQLFGLGREQTRKIMKGIVWSSTI